MSSIELEDIGQARRPPEVAVRDPAQEEPRPRGRTCSITWQKFIVAILIVSLMIALMVFLVYYMVNEESSTADVDSDIPNPQASVGEDVSVSDSNEKALDGSTDRQYNLKTIQRIMNKPNRFGSLIANMINGNILAPAIHVKNGSWVHFRVSNGIANKIDDTANFGLGIHWHGLDMRGAQIFDGVVGLTQCPIMKNNTYDYNWQINEEPGTYWYHSHDRKMFPDGQTDFTRGAFIIHPSDSNLPLPSPDAEAADSYQVGNEIVLFFSDSEGAGILNGEKHPNISVNEGSEYRIRIINGIHSHPSSLIFSIGAEFGDKSKGGRIPLTVIATDGYPVEDFEVDAINIAIAERYDVKVTFPKNSSNANAYIYGAGSDIETESFVAAVGILLIGGGENTNIVPKAGEMTAETRVLNCYNFSESYVANNGTCIPVTNLTSTKAWYHLDKWDDTQFFDMVKIRGNETNPTYFEVSLNKGDYIKNRIPCYALVKKSSQDKHRGGTAIMSLPTNKSVTIMLRVKNHPGSKNPVKPGDGTHPMHLHGHHFEVLGIANGEKNTNCTLQPDDDHSDPTEYYFGQSIDKLRERKGVLKDTVILPVCGAVVLRINTDNPGVWFFHCHIAYHLHHGLAAVINEGNYMFSRDDTSFPDDYPPCEPCADLNS